MEESSAPPVELVGDEGSGRVPEARTAMNMANNYGWGQIPMMGSGSYYPPQYQHHPPAYYNYPPPRQQLEGGGGSGMYPNLGFRYPRPPYFPVHGARLFMECPICRERLIKPIYQCHNGHVLCNRCIDAQEFCMECSASLVGPKIRNIALENIVEQQEGNCGSAPGHYPWATTEIKCPNSDEGCEFVSGSAEIGGHLEVCEFRAVPFCSKALGWSLCSSEVNTASIIDHLRDHHENQILEKDQSKFSLELILSKNVLHHGVMSTSGLIWEPIVIASVLDRDVLIKCAVSQNGNLIMNGYLLGGSINEAKDYRVKYELNSSSKTSRLEWTGSLLSFRQFHASDHLFNVNAFSIPILTFKEFFKDHFTEDGAEAQSSLKIRISVWKIGDDLIASGPYRECFRSIETGERDSLDKITLIGIPPNEISGSSFPFAHSSNATTLDASCGNCDREIFGVAYQCLQCPETTFFCRNCIEHGNAHGEHLTLRITNAKLHIPLAAVVYECSAAEISS